MINRSKYIWDKTCLQCSKVIKPFHIYFLNKSFCSRKCRAIYRTVNNCKYCGEPRKIGDRFICSKCESIVVFLARKICKDSGKYNYRGVSDQKELVLTYRLLKQLEKESYESRHNSERN